MSEFRQLPQSFGGKQDDELLLVTPSTATRTTIKSLFWDNYALLKFKFAADQSYGIGTANTWATLPFNNLNQSGASPWLTLNPNGSFLLNDGLYMLSAAVSLLACDRQRLALFRGAQIIELVHQFSAFSSTAGMTLKLCDRFSVVGQQTFSVAVSTEAVRTNSLNAVDGFLAGQQSTVAICEVIKLG